MAGRVISRGDPAYEDARQAALWNGRVPERFPDVIVQATSVQDVVAAVEFAKSRRLKVAIRSGGHSWCGSPLRDGGVLIDLSELRKLSVDPSSRTAMVEPAVTGGDLARALEKVGLAFPVGHCPSVGMGGYLLSGGLGWNSNTWGYGTYSVRAIDVVTSAGRLVHASEHENPDLFWAARGSGSGFPGVVTSFQLDVYPLPTIATSAYIYPVTAIGEIATWLETVRASLPREVELTIMLSSAPGDAQGGTSIVVLGTAFSDSAEQAAHALSPLETCPALATALSRHVADPTPFSALHSIIDSLSPEGHRYAADTLWSNAGTVDVLQALGRVPQPPSPTSLVVAVMHAPRPQREAVADTAFSMSGAFWITCYEFWDDDADDDAHTTWVRQVMETFAPLEIGHYVGEVDLLAAKDRASRSFSEQSWERLQTLRANLDPDNVFHSFLQP